MWWRTLLKWLTGDVVGQLVNAYAKAKDSAVESEKTRAEVLKKQLDNAVAAQKLANEVRLATASYPEMRILTFLIAAPFVLHAALVGLDTCFSLSWRIAAYPPPFNEWEGAILLSFFGLQIGGKAVNAIAAAFIARR